MTVSNEKSPSMAKSRHEGYVYAVSFGSLIKVGYSKSRPDKRVASHTKFAKNVLGLDVSRVFVSDLHYKPRVTEDVLIKKCSEMYDGVAFGTEWFSTHDGGLEIFRQLECQEIPMRRATESEIAKEQEDSDGLLKILFGLRATNQCKNERPSRTSVGAMLQSFAHVSFGEMTLHDQATEEDLWLHDMCIDEAPQVFGIIGDCLDPEMHSNEIYGLMDMLSSMRLGARDLELNTENSMDRQVFVNVSHAVSKALVDDDQQSSTAISRMLGIVSYFASMNR